jgi:hypothetical protein
MRDRTVSIYEPYRMEKVGAEQVVGKRLLFGERIALIVAVATNTDRVNAFMVDA